MAGDPDTESQEALTSRMTNRRKTTSKKIKKGTHVQRVEF
jgi:hypothetical protein